MPKGIFKNPIERSKRISRSNTGKKFSKERKRKMSESHIGYVMPKEQKEKIRLKSMGRICSEKTRLKIALKLKGNKNYKYRIFTPEAIKKMKIARKNREPISEETRLKMRLAKLGKGKNIIGSREKLLRKNGGYHTSFEWKILKRFVNYICVSCGKKEPEIKLVKDHIQPVILGGKDFIWNIQPLCKKCNGIKWIKFHHYLGEFIKSGKSKLGMNFISSIK